MEKKFDVFSLLEYLLKLRKRVGWLVVGIKADCLTRDLGL